VISAVIVDFTMPNLNGDAVIQEIHRERPDMPVFLMSGFAEEDTVKEFAHREWRGSYKNRSHRQC
jgi:DNA-binding NtrC family response regulator